VNTHGRACDHVFQAGLRSHAVAVWRRAGCLRDIRALGGSAEDEDEECDGDPDGSNGEQEEHGLILDDGWRAVVTVQVAGCDLLV
jgi:hypothetical protein